MKTAALMTAKRRVPAGKTAAVRGLQIRTILVPTDFSPPAAKALEYARAFAQAFRAKLHLINVFDVQFEAPSLAPYFATDDQVERRLRQRLRDIVTVFAEPIRNGQCHARIGRAFDEICKEAERIHADLIVTATRGFTGFKHVLLGSTAERIVRHASCPVLVVREKEREFAGGIARTSGRKPEALRVRHILVPTDFSEHSQTALQYAVGLAKRFGARITLMNAIHPQYFAVNPEMVAIDYGQLLDSIRAAVRGEMDDFVRGNAFQGVPFQTHTEEGHPGDLVVQYAEECGADLIVNATHGRTGLAHVLLGSTAEFIVRYAKCPVLIVPTVRMRKRARTR